MDFVELAKMMLHLDTTLGMFLENYGLWVYAILFLIVFCETGLVVTPFLPGDSLLFVAGAFAAAGRLDLAVLISSLTAAAILGNTVNYAVGRYIGPKVFLWPNSRFFNRDALARAHQFYEKHGGKTLVISRFMPIFRTFTPFVAGVSSMTFGRYQLFNITGAVGWVVSLCLVGYFFGNLPWAKANLSLVIFSIIGISMLPLFVAWIKNRIASRAAAAE